MLCYIGSLKLIYFIVLKLSWSAETPPKATCHGFLLSLLFAFIGFLRTIVLIGHVTLKYTLFTVVTVRALASLDNNGSNNYLYNKHIYP